MEEKANTMQYRYLGNTGVRVSVIGYGHMLSNYSEEQRFKSADVIQRCIELGINYLDTAELYGENQESEIHLGQVLQSLFQQKITSREDLVISTKIFGMAKKPNQQAGLSRKRIIEATNKCLKRLQLDYVDIIFAHRFDVNVPLEEQCKAFSWLIDQGKAFYWGTSEWPADMLEKAIRICEQYNLHRPIVEQAEYHLFQRNRMEKDLVPLFEGYKLGTTTWSPLMGGILTGKYNEGIPEGSRYNLFPMAKSFMYDKYFNESVLPDTLKKLQAFGALAKENEWTQAQLALGWHIANTDVSTCLIGASSLDQLEENVKCLDVVKCWNKELEEKINKIFGNSPETLFNFVAYSPCQPRRQKMIQ